MATEKPDSKAHSAPAAEPANGNTSPSGSAENAGARPPVRWAKRLLAVAGAVATIGAAVTVISQATNWLDGIIGSQSPGTHAVSEIERSPTLGISFYQNGQLAPMSYAGYGNGAGVNPPVTVTMKRQPFEIWFPTLGSNAFLQICAWHTDYIFGNAARTAREGEKSCLALGHEVADFPYSGGGLWLSPPGNLANTAIGQTRAQPAAGGDEKFYVSNLASVRGKFYLAIYLNTNNFASFQSTELEDFILNFSS